MELIFTKKDMISFIEWYDEKQEVNCYRTFEEEFNAWVKESRSICDNCKKSCRSEKPLYTCMAYEQK